MIRFQVGDKVFYRDNIGPQEVQGKELEVVGITDIGEAHTEYSLICNEINCVFKARPEELKKWWWRI